MAFNTMINRTGAEALIPQNVSDSIVQEAAKSSLFMSLASRMPNMTAKQMKIPVATGLAEASWLESDSELKPTTNLTWDKVFITAEEIACLVPIPEAVLDDASYDIWGEVRPRIAEAFAKAIDAATLFGTNKPSSFPNGLVTGAVAAGNVVNWNGTSKTLYDAIMGEQGVLAKVEESGIAVNGYMGALPLRAKLRGCVDANKQPIFRTAYSNGVSGAFNYELEGHPISFVDNGSWDGSNNDLLLAGNFQYAKYAVRQDITYKISTEGTIVDASGKVILSALQQDCVILRAVMRMGWALPKPVNAVAGTNYYPFAVLRETVG